MSRHANREGPRGPRHRLPGGGGAASRRQLCAALLGLLALAALGVSPPALLEAGRGHALPSRLATQSLLLDVARAGGRLVAVGEWGHVVLSDDAGETWRQAASVPTQRTLTEVFFASARRGWAVGHDAVVLHTSDGGENWELQFEAAAEEANLLSVWFADTQHGLAAGAFGLLIETRDGGRTWQRRELEVAGEDEPHLNHVFAGPGDSIFIAAEFGSVFRSQGAGGSWERLDPPYQGSFWGGLTLDDGTILIFGMRGHAFRSEDGGDSWQVVDTDTDQSLQAAAELADGTVVLVGLGGVVAESRDGGLTFSAAVESDRRGIAAVAEGAGGSLLLFGETGVRVRGGS